ncbi:MAG: LEA type 2 family protein [Bacteroidota bacterium]|nr:LEA type 2 family protein [Bacteroidota bacterium]
MKKPSIATLAIISILFSACLKEPTLVAVKNVEIVSAQGNSLIINASTLIDNPNNSNLVLDNVNFEFSIDNTLIGTGTLDSTMNLKANAQTVVNSKNSLSVRELGDAYSKYSGKESIPLDILITAKFSKIKLPVKRKFTQHISISELMNDLISEEDLAKALKIKRISLEKAGIFSTYLKIDVEFKNKFSLDYKISQMNTKIYDNNDKSHHLGDAILQKEIIVPAGGKVEFSLNSQTKNLSAIISLLDRVRERNAGIFVEGSATVELSGQTFKFPINQKIDNIFF